MHRRNWFSLQRKTKIIKALLYIADIFFTARETFDAKANWDIGKSVGGKL